MSKRLGIKKKRLLLRDGPYCGIHVGGCGKTIKIGEAKIDHIIPQNLYTPLVEYPQRFDKDWNKQLMHTKCNKNKGSETNYNPPNPNEQFLFTWTNAPDQLPNFRCQCHFWQIFDEDLYVGTQGILGEDQQKLVPSIVADYEEPGRQDAKMIVGFQTGRGRKTEAGYNRRQNMGYMLPTIPSRLVSAFNSAELHRVGFPTLYYPVGYAKNGSIWMFNRKFAATTG